ncbi:hypothetical protein LH646_30505 (plasmid) [Streptomyces sp. WA1-19]|uniref:hypothetical protein n=1 Tax=Streptomyces TaxID=1883 RepID=UPI000A3F2ED9|nr:MULTISPECIES: hypothetical protein [Streptomyces]UDF11868.1 hypothetical protein LH646_30505 [Streptomyces sp. WA1-19]
MADRDRKKIKLPKPVKKPQSAGTAEQHSADRPRDVIELRTGFTLPKTWRR